MNVRTKSSYKVQKLPTQSSYSVAKLRYELPNSNIQSPAKSQKSTKHNNIQRHCSCFQYEQTGLDLTS